MTTSKPISSSMKSPCTKICQIDRTNGLCLGCYRTLDEIAGWGRMSDAEREVILLGLEGRRATRPESLAEMTD
ncbi:DUF1289 domain-containing protein [Roseibium polysiphoniae]|uniref:DUF1289 domain-containing protein n=1 Tax=Roseibium polysiphoniae TaxID=2571221 RepID=A0ABR9C543_9HYPH|nr:DUF1289 domain-containing protein [Roseibium polysiphoniae]MBD8874980.1 DUF1289 domain-containing protein [Roseibium polysiphoniae]